MTKPTKRLGRGLDSLINSTITSPDAKPAEPEANTPLEEPIARSTESPHPGGANSSPPDAQPTSSATASPPAAPPSSSPVGDRAGDNVRTKASPPPETADLATADVVSPDARQQPETTPSPAVRQSTTSKRSARTSRTSSRRQKAGTRKPTGPSSAVSASGPMPSGRSQPDTPSGGPKSSDGTAVEEDRQPDQGDARLAGRLGMRTFAEQKAMLDSVEIADVDGAGPASRGGGLKAALGRHRVLPVDQIIPHSLQPRQSASPEGIASLARSIGEAGVIQPLVVRPLPTDQLEGDDQARYELVAGERRWLAAGLAKLAEVPVVVRELTDEQALEIALIENIQREDLNAIDRATAYGTYCRKFDLKADQVASRLGEDRTTVINYLRLLELPQAVKDMVGDGRLTMGHARCLLGIADDKTRVDLARSTAANGISVRTLEDIVRRRKSSAEPERVTAEKAPAPRPAHVVDVENRLQQAIGTKVMIRPGRTKGTGRIVVEYYSLDDFDRIARMLGLRDE